MRKEKINEVVCRIMGVPEESMILNRKRQFVDAKYLCIVFRLWMGWQIRRVGGVKRDGKYKFSFSIGRIMRSRVADEYGVDRATVYHAVKKVKNLIEVEPDFRQKFYQIKTELGIRKPILWN
jgi:hypothetical protein